MNLKNNILTFDNGERISIKNDGYYSMCHDKLTPIIDEVLIYQIEAILDKIGEDNELQK